MNAHIQKAAAHIFTRDFGERLLLFASTLVALGVLLFGIWELHRKVIVHWIPIVPLSLAVASILFQTFLALLLLIISAHLKRRDQARLLVSSRNVPIIREHLAAFTLRETDQAKLTDFRRRDPKEFEICLLEFLKNMSGPSRDRLSRLASTLGLVETWKRRASNGDTHAIESLGLLTGTNTWSFIEGLTDHYQTLVRVAAFRVLARAASCGEYADSAKVFRAVFASPLLVRVMLAGELRQYATHFDEQNMSALLSGLEAGQTFAALEMMESWHCGLPIAGLAALTRHPDFRIRAAALRLAACDATRAGANHAWARVYLPASRSNQNSLVPAVIRAMGDDNRQVRAAALDAAARMGVRSALASITLSAEQTDANVSSLACLALSTMGQRGHAALQEKVMRGNPRVAAAAVESLAAAKLAAI